MVLAESAVDNSIDTTVDTTAKEATRYLTDLAEIRRAFLIYRNQRSKLILRFANDSSMFTTRLLDVTDEELLLEDLQPRSGLQLLRTATEFSLSGRSQGQYVMADCNRVRKASAERGVPYFHVALPASLLFQQRRREQRIALSFDIQGSGANILIPSPNPNAPAVQGELVDISSGGCRVTYKVADVRLLEDQSLVEGCQLHIHDHLQLTTSVQVRHSTIDMKHDEQQCGLEFIRMSVTDRRRLEQFVQPHTKQQPR
jgi:c-di-GMP-binding flagellar brake protein YcgR